MIAIYTIANRAHPCILNEQNYLELKQATWIDIFSPTIDEIMWLESALGILVPTRAAMQEIELSSRLYETNGTLYMTATLVEGALSENPKDDSVTFILTNNQLLTLRYIEPTAFLVFTKEIKQLSEQHFDCAVLLIYLLEIIIDRSADILEMVVYNLDQFSKRIFHQSYAKNTSPSLNYLSLMQDIGRNAELSGQERESLLTINRLLSFFNQAAASRLEQSYLLRLKTMSQDVVSLSDYSNFITGKVTFLLDATLGMVNIEQNNIIKIFSVAAVIFLPPTLIASIYGMNFHEIPELRWAYGYGFALLLMLLSAILPYRFFKARKWL